MRRYFGILAGVSIVAAIVSYFLIDQHLFDMQQDIAVCQYQRAFGNYLKTCPEPPTWLYFITAAFGVAAVIFLIIAFVPRNKPTH